MSACKPFYSQFTASLYAWHNNGMSEHDRKQAEAIENGPQRKRYFWWKYFVSELSGRFAWLLPEFAPAFSILEARLT